MESETHAVKQQARQMELEDLRKQIALHARDLYYEDCFELLVAACVKYARLQEAARVCTGDTFGFCPVCDDNDADLLGPCEQHAGS